MEKTHCIGSLLAVLLSAAAHCAAAEDWGRVVGLFRDQAIVEVDGRQIILKAGGPAKRGIRLLSTDAQEAVFEVDGVEFRYRHGTGIGSNQPGAPSAGKTVQIAPDTGGMYFVSGAINGYAVRFLVDTGATLVAMNKRTAKRLGINYMLDGEEGLSQTASGYARTYLVKLNKVTVGEITLTDVEGAVIDGDQPLEVLLGNSFLGRVNMERKGRLLMLRMP
ncbi:MAG: TIGR02281 family clan AA aspartic protease [Gammaproteobacteria bacterium]